MERPSDRRLHLQIAARRVGEDDCLCGIFCTQRGIHLLIVIIFTVTLASLEVPTV
ncbi:MAG: hypothetical protein OXH57_00185 [Ekhidna sp.]|nr:hypothetical protein [Ekhidna sp.]